MNCQYCFKQDATNPNGLCDQCNRESDLSPLWHALTAMAIFGGMFALYVLAWSTFGIPVIG